MKLKAIRKAITPLAISAVLAVLAVFGIEEGATVREVVTMVVEYLSYGLMAAIGVYYVPNDPS